MVVLSHLLEKFSIFFAYVRRGRLFLFFSIACGRLSFYVSRFLNTGIERQHQYLFYKLLDTSVTLFLQILWRDSHSWLMTPRMLCTNKNTCLTWCCWAKDYLPLFILELSIEVLQPIRETSIILRFFLTWNSRTK